MAFRREQEQRAVVIASARAAADAEFLKVTLAVNGIPAMVSAASVVFPSIDFVEGAYVSVAAADAERARAMLNALGLARDELEPPDQDGDPPG